MIENNILPGLPDDIEPVLSDNKPLHEIIRAVRLSRKIVARPYLVRVCDDDIDVRSLNETLRAFRQKGSVEDSVRKELTKILAEQVSLLEQRRH